MLNQALILNELGYFNESLAICDYLVENHFKPDDLYFKMMEVRIYALDNLEL